MPGPLGELGYFLRAPGAGSLASDLAAEIASNELCWLNDRGGWWVARPRAGILAAILERHHLYPHEWLTV